MSVKSEIGAARIEVLNIYIVVSIPVIQVHRYHSLQVSTQLGEELLSQALLSLTTQPHNILIPSAHHCPNVPFSPNTAFILNHKFLSEVAKQQRSHCIWLHDARVTVGNHRNKEVDLAHLFERRRNIIDAAIVRILKRDREASMDTISNIVSVDNHISCKIILL